MLLLPLDEPAPDEAPFEFICSLQIEVIEAVALSVPGLSLDVEFIPDPLDLHLRVRVCALFLLLSTFREPCLVLSLSFGLLRPVEARRAEIDLLLSDQVERGVHIILSALQVLHFVLRVHHGGDPDLGPLVQELVQRALRLVREDWLHFRLLLRLLLERIDGAVLLRCLFLIHGLVEGLAESNALDLDTPLGY